MKKIAYLLFFSQLVILFSCKSGSENASGSGNTATAGSGETANVAPAASSTGEAMVLIETNVGNIKVKLYDSTPKHKENFLKLTKEGFYAGTLFHRVIPGFMIQGGDPDSKNAQQGQPLGMGGPDYTLDAEISAKHFRGALSAARQGDQVNPEKRSSGSQFYIVQNGPVPAAQLDQIIQQKGLQYTPEERDYYLKVGGTPFLDGDYTVFGQVVEGMEVVDKIANAQRDGRDRPIENIVMKKVSVIE
jgi:peptidyl-prolyl cis-trans isomerase B (cyclophilin B)